MSGLEGISDSGCVVPNLGLFSKFKMVNIQHWPCCQLSMICATLKTTVNSELRKLDFSEFKTTGKSGINELRQGKYILNSHPTPNCKSGLFLELRRSMTSSWFDHVFFRVPSCFESTINPENARLECQKGMLRWRRIRWLTLYMTNCAILLIFFALFVTYFLTYFVHNVAATVSYDRN